MWKTLGAIVTVAIAIVLAVAAWPQFFGLQQAIGPAQIVSLRGAAVALALVLAVLLCLLAIGRPLRVLSLSVAALLVGFAAVGGVIVIQRGIDADTPRAMAGTDEPSSITVLTWNTRGDSVSANTVAAVAVRYGADVLALPETTAAAATKIASAMTASARPMIAHTVSFDDGRASHSTSLLVSTGLGAYSVTSPATPGDGANTTDVPTMVAIPEHGDGPTIVAVHATAPVPARMDMWRSDLQWLASLCAQGHGDSSHGNTILAGDFNATIDSMWSLRTPTGQLGDCADAALANEVAGIGTWPTILPAVLGAPIDHVMSTPDWTASNTHVLTGYDDDGSDHRPVVATLVPSSGG